MSDGVGKSQVSRPRDGHGEAPARSYCYQPPAKKLKQTTLADLFPKKTRTITTSEPPKGNRNYHTVICHSGCLTILLPCTFRHKRQSWRRPKL
jgi:hypothetical protein